MWSSLTDFVTWFVITVINPMINMLKSVPIFGHTLFDWFISLAVVSLAVSFYRWFWDMGDKKD